MNYRSLILAVILALLPAAGCQKDKSGPTPEQLAKTEARKKKAEEFKKRMAERRQAMKNEPPPVNRCPEKMSKELRLVKGDKVIWTKSNSDIVFAAGAVTPQKDGKAVVGLTWIPVKDILPGGEKPAAIELVPCTGDPVRIDWKDVESDLERYRLTMNRRGLLKLLNLPASGKAQDDAAGDDDADGETPAVDAKKSASETEPLKTAPKRERRELGRNLYELRLIP